MTEVKLTSVLLSTVWEIPEVEDACVEDDVSVSGELECVVKVTYVPEEDSACKEESSLTAEVVLMACAVLLTVVKVR